MDLGPVEAVDAESFGEPGNRTFRLMVRAGQGTVSLWLEKQQVVGLGAAIQELLEQTPEVEESREPASQAFRGEFEVHVGSLGIGHSKARRGFVIEAGDFETAFDLSSIEFLASRGQVAALLDQIHEIVAAGRPRCVLCGTPLTGEPHLCPESNGHARLTGEHNAT